jgi:hypothetical protein
MTDIKKYFSFSKTITDGRRSILTFSESLVYKRAPSIAQFKKLLNDTKQRKQVSQLITTESFIGLLLSDNEI